MFGIFKRKPTLTKDDLYSAISQHREQIEKLGGSYDFLATALNIADKDEMFQAGGYISAETYPFRKVMLLQASLQLLNLWFELDASNRDVEQHTKDVILARAFQGWILASQILSVDELTEYVKGEPGIKLGTREDFIQSVFGSGVMHRLMGKLKLEAEGSFEQWKSPESRQLLRDNFQASL
jgi:hypothetical protein